MDDDARTEAEAPVPPNRRVGFAVVAALLGLVVATGVVEAAVRAWPPRPRLQVVRLDQPSFAWEDRGGVPLWWDPVYAGGPIRGAACAPGAPVIGVAGDSVLMTVEAEGDGHRVADALRDATGACVQDGSWPGYLPYQELGMLRWIDERTPLSVAVLSVWKEDRRYHHLGDTLYDSELVEHDPATGLPASPIPGVPASLHAALFTRSRAWEFVTTTLAASVYEPRDPAGAYLEAVDWAASEGIPLVVVEAVPLDAPFELSATRRREAPDTLWTKRVEAAARAKGFAYVVLADALAGLDHEAIRLDTCCHFTSEGHAKVAEALLPHVRDALARAASREPR